MRGTNRELVEYSVPNQLTALKIMRALDVQAAGTLLHGL
jgi:hypothetical protein